MLCLIDTLRLGNPSWQPLLSAVETAPTVASMILAAWRLARVLAAKIVEEVLTERARCGL